MLTIRTCKVFSKALGEYLRQADYYAQGMKVEGRCYGRLCQRVGLTESAVITDDAFERVASNHHALTAEKLTERMAAGRRAGYDGTFNAPKSVSIQAFIGDDERLVAAHELAVTEALAELETCATHQAGRGVNKHYATSGEIAAAVFRHGESRALDPHLHSHAFIFNVTRERETDRLLALESSPIFERTKYLTEVYRNALAREVSRLGYEIERHSHGFELAGIPAELLERFSKRAKQRDLAIRAREAELGRELSRNEIAGLIRETRAEKQYELTTAEVRCGQLAQLSEGELRELRALRKNARAPTARDERGVSTVIARATGQIFERRTVVPEYEFIAEVIRQAYGKHLLGDLKAAIAATPSGLLRAEGQISIQTALDFERSLVRFLNAGVGACDSPFGFATLDALAALSLEQRNAVRSMLGSCDRVTVFRGRAGTGKTHALATAIEGMRAIGRDVACFAPSSQAVAILKSDGAAQVASGRAEAAAILNGAETVQRLLVDAKLQSSIRSKVLVVDEYGLLSVRQLKELLDVAEARRARVILVGDSAQHKSVEAGDAARIVETESRVGIAELREVRRQAANPAYKAAAEDLAAGRIDAALQKLDRMEAIVEVENPLLRRRQMVAEWLDASEETKVVRTFAGVHERAKTALMVAPTWSEIDALNSHAREALRNTGKLAREEQGFDSLRSKDWTRSQHKDVRNYQPGDILVAHRSTKHFQRGEELRVVRRERERLVVARGDERFSVSPRQSGLAWTACTATSLAVSSGDKLRLRAITPVQTRDGRNDRLANGTIVIVKSVDSSGRLLLTDGSTLLGRQVVYGYAMTSHAAQGVTVDKVFLAGANSREGLYVSATRGREGIRIFVPDREAFLEGAGLRNETRTSAIEFARHRARIPPEVADYLTMAWRHLREVHASIAASIATGSLWRLGSKRIGLRFSTMEGEYREEHSAHHDVRESPVQAPRMRL